MRSALWLRSKLSNILPQDPIILFLTSPKCDAWGRLKIHFVALSCKYWATGPCSTNDTSILNSLDAPTNFVPLSLQKMETGPHFAIKRRRALMEEALESSSFTSMCTPQVTKHENSKIEVPKDVRNSKVWTHDKFKRDSSRRKNTCKSQSGTELGVRRSKRLLSECNTGCKCPFDTYMQ